MENLTLSQDGLTIQPFEIQSETAMLYVETTGTLTFHVSVDGATHTAWPETVSVTEFIHLPLHNLKKGSRMKITCTGTMSNPKIMW